MNWRRVWAVALVLEYVFLGMWLFTPLGVPQKWWAVAIIVSWVAYMGGVYFDNYYES